MSKLEGFRWPNMGHFEQCFEYTVFKKVHGYVLILPQKLEGKGKALFTEKG